MALFEKNKDSQDREQPMAKQVSAAAPSQINIIAEGTVFEGTLTADTDVRVSGRIVGKLAVNGRAVIAEEGTVEGEVSATDASIAGTVQGDLIIQERLMLGSSAQIEGTIKTGRLIVEEGATFNGECQTGQPGQIRKKSSVAPPNAASRRPDLPREERPDRSKATDNNKVGAPSNEPASKL